MRQCTEPTFTFTLPIDTDIVDECRVTFAQYGSVILTKETDECEMSGNIITVDLTPDETLLFDHKDTAQAQLQALTTGGDPLVSDIFSFDVGECISGEVLI